MKYAFSTVSFDEDSPITCTTWDAITFCGM